MLILRKVESAQMLCLSSVLSASSQGKMMKRLPLLALRYDSHKLVGDDTVAGVGAKPPFRADMGTSDIRSLGQ